jgi:hypothetical protein
MDRGELVVVYTNNMLHMQLKRETIVMLSLSALVLSMGLSMQPQSTAAAVPVTEVIAMLTVKPEVQRADRMKVMPEEVRETVQLYLNGKIDQWYARADGKGVVFLLRAKTVDEAKQIMEGLPLHKAGYVQMEYIPVGPLAPLRFLAGPQSPADAAGSH